MRAGLGTPVGALSSYLTECGIKEGTLWGPQGRPQAILESLISQKGRHSRQFFISFSKLSVQIIGNQSIQFRQKRLTKLPIRSTGPE